MELRGILPDVESTDLTAYNNVRFPTYDEIANPDDALLLWGEEGFQAWMRRRTELWFQARVKRLLAEGI